MRVYKLPVKLILFVLLNFALCLTASAQANVVSLGSSTPAQWVPVDLGVTPTNNNVTIRKGDTISIDTTATCARLVIDTGATLNSVSNAADGNVFNLQAGLGADTLLNNGTFGSADGTHDGIVLAIPSSCSSLKLSGGGITAIGAIRPAAYNAGLTLDIDQNVTLNYKGIAFSTLPIIDSNTTVDKITFNIDTGKTVAFINPHAKLHGTQPDQTGGQYIYNIYGTLDMGASTDTSAMPPLFNSPSSAITLNVGGKLILGSAFSTYSFGPADQPGGPVYFNIQNNAVVDATRTTLLSLDNNYFTTIGTGILKRSVGNTGVNFPVGAEGSASGSPVTLNNKGKATNFSVSVKNQFDNPVPNSNKVVNKQWTIVPDSAGIANVTVTPSWLAADQAAGFKTTASIAVLNYNGTQWKETPATLSGQGTPLNIYSAAAPGFTTFGAFAVANSEVDKNATTNLKAYPNPATANISFSFPATGSNGSIKIVSTSGENKVTSAISTGTTNWNANISGWSPGIYIVTVQDGAKRTSAKFIKL